MSNNVPAPYGPGQGISGYTGRSAPAMGGGGAPPPGDPPELAFKRLLGALIRYKWMILMLVALGGAAGVVAGRFQQSIYRVQSQIWINDIGMVGGGNTGPFTQGTLLTPQAWVGLLKSSTVMDSVVLRRRLYLGLEDRSDTLAFDNFQYDRPNLVAGAYRIELDPTTNRVTLADAQGDVVQQAAAGDSIGTSLGFRWAPDPAFLPRDRAILFSIRPPDEATRTLRDRIQTAQGRPPNDQSYLGLTIEGPDKYEISATMNAVLERFDSVAIQLKRERLSLNADILKQQLDTAEEDLTAAEAEMQGFKVNTITLPMEDRGLGVPLPAGLAVTDNTVYGNFFTLNTTKDQLAREQAMIRRALGSQDLTAMVTALEFVPSAQNNSSLNAALREAATLETSIRVLSQTYTEQHEQVRVPRAQLDSLETAVIPVLAGQLLDELSRREADYASQIAAAGAEMKQIPQRVIRSNQIQRNYEVADELYRELQRRYQAAELAELTTTPDIKVLDRPGVPSTPVNGTSPILLLGFLAGGLALGLIGAILRDRFDHRVLYPEQVTGGLGLNILGAVPALRSGRLGASDMALAVEAFRSIQLSLMHTNENGGPLMVTFSSPGASDGKSFVTSNLAIAFADMGHRTLVIDGDLRRGTMHRLLDAAKKPGLTEFLTGSVKRAEIIQETKYPLLYAITSGTRGAAGPKMLGSPAMRQLMRDLAPDFDVILVDSPPLGACVDPMILGTLTRNLVLVLRTGTTDRQLAESKLDMLDRLPVRVVGAVLNDVAPGGTYKYYRYMGGYEVMEDEPEQIGSGSEEEEAEDRKPIPTG